MTEERVVQFIAAQLGLEYVQLGPEAGLDQFPEWDSLAHVLLMLAIEEEFGRLVSPEDALHLTTVERICAFICHS